MSPQPVHRELVLPNPVEKTPDLRIPTEEAALTIAAPHTSWLEIHWSADGRARYHVGASTDEELNLTLGSLRESFPGAESGARTACPIGPMFGTAGHLLRAVQNEQYHYWPMNRLWQADRAGLLLDSLSGCDFGRYDAVLQILFKRVVGWEFGFFSPSIDGFVEEVVAGRDRDLLSKYNARRGLPAYHVEIRAGILGPDPCRVCEVLGATHPLLVSEIIARNGNPIRLPAVRPGAQDLRPLPDFLDRHRRMHGIS
jgi:hypothetical protein